MPGAPTLFFRNSNAETQKHYREKKWLLERLLTGVLSKEDELTLMQERILSEAACLKHIKNGVFSEEAKPAFIKHCKDLYYIIELADENLQLRQLCLSEKLTSFWQKLLANPREFKKCAKWPKDNFAFKEQPLIPVFDLICGIYFYYRYLRERKYFNDLKRAALRYHFFPALLKLIDVKKLWQASKEKSNENFLTEAYLKLEQAERAVQFHGTPAYILCANLNLCLAQYYRHNGAEPFRVSGAYGRALFYYELAKRIELKSEAALYNAYRGKGIAVTNPQRYDNIVDLQTACIKLAGEFLLPFEIEAGKKFIEQKFKQIDEKEPFCSISFGN